MTLACARPSAMSPVETKGEKHGPQEVTLLDSPSARGFHRPEYYFPDLAQEATPVDLVESFLQVRGKEAPPFIVAVFFGAII